MIHLIWLIKEGYPVISRPKSIWAKAPNVLLDVVFPGETVPEIWCTAMHTLQPTAKNVQDANSILCFFSILYNHLALSWPQGCYELSHSLLKTF